MTLTMIWILCYGLSWLFTAILLVIVDTRRDRAFVYAMITFLTMFTIHIYRTLSL